MTEIETTFFQQLADHWISILIMAGILYWFVKQMEKKDKINQENTEKFIQVTKEYSSVVSKVNLHLDETIAQMRQHHNEQMWKLQQIHNDIKK